MLVLTNFADKESLKGKYGLIEYPKYYLNKDFDYLICDIGDSFDAKGERVMTHGGMSIDEVIVPFIKIPHEEGEGGPNWGNDSLIAVCHLQMQSPEKVVKNS